jgi:hypothetical protein
MEERLETIAPVLVRRLPPIPTDRIATLGWQATSGVHMFGGSKPHPDRENATREMNS